MSSKTIERVRKNKSFKTPVEPLTYSVSAEEVFESLSGVFWSFYLIGIPIRERQKPKLCNFFRKILWLLPQAIAHACYIWITLVSLSLSLIYKTARSPKINLATLIFAVVGIALRYTIYFQRGAIGRFVKLLVEFQPQALTREALKRIKLLVVIFHILALVQLFVVPGMTIHSILLIDERNRLYIRDFFFGFLKNDDRSFLANFFRVAAVFGFAGCVFVPLSCLSMLFCILAYILKKYFDKLAEKAATRKFTVAKLLQKFDRIDELVVTMDETFSFTILLATITTANSIYYNSVAFLHLNLGRLSMLYVAPVLSLCVNTVIVVFISCFASEIHDSSQKIEPLLPELEDDDGSFFNKLWFVLKMKQDIYLTAWKIFPLTKIFILGYLGTIFTYSLLIDSLQAAKFKYQEPGNTNLD